MQEFWKPIPNYEGLYEASIFGRVRSLDRTTLTKNGKSRKIKGKILKQIYTEKDPRPQVSLCKNFSVNIFRVHVLVMLTFVGPRPDGLDICHNDGCTTNNCIGNLRYDTQSNNEKDKIIHGTAKRGGNCNFTKLTDEQVKEIRELSKTNLSQSEIAAKFNISRQQVSKIKLNTRWAWLR